MKHFAAALAAFVAPAAVIALACPAEADVLIDNVNGMSFGADGQVQRFNGVLVGDDGRIVQVLQRADKRPGNVDYRLDGKGQVLLPGLIDSHAQVMKLGFAQLALDLSAARTLAEAQARIAAYAAAHPERQWILGRGWNAGKWGLGRLPTAADLDAAISDRPVWLIDASGHSGWANSAALAAAGVSAATKDPAGGRIHRVPGGMKPAGVLDNEATALIEAHIPPPRAEDRDLALGEAQQVLLRQGVTTVADMGATIEDWQTYRRAGDLGRLRLRIVAYAVDTDAMALIGGPGPTPWLYDDRLRLNGVSLTLDGALAARGAALKAPYADQPGNRGLSRLNGTRLRNLMSRAAIDGFQVALTAHGDAANADALAAIEELSETYKGDRRWRIEQAQVIDPADFARFGRNGIVTSMQPQDLEDGRGVAEARLGPARLAGTFAWRSISGAGAVLAFGSGAPAEKPAPFAGMAMAITRQGADGQPFGGWQAQERLTREAALAAYGTSAAHALFAEGRFGRIERGQRGDFILVDHDPLLASPDELRATRVLQTWVGGKLVYQAKDSSAGR